MTYKTIQNLRPKEKFTTTKKIVEIDCDMCGYDRGLLTRSSYASAGLVKCNNPHCEYQIDTL